MESNWASGLVCVSSRRLYIAQKLLTSSQVSWTVREMHARLSTARVLSSRTGVRSHKSDRSFSTTSRPSNKGNMGKSEWSLLPVDRRSVIAGVFVFAVLI
jgi:hypothetical protein